MKRLSTLMPLIAAALSTVTATAADPPSSMSMPGMQMTSALSAQKQKLGHTTGKVVQAIGAGACALHMPGASLPFIALWYAGPILLCALIGALLGPRVLRW